MEPSRHSQATSEELPARLEQLTSALREKEVLLRELHHRVKNNLQVISSLLNLQARRIEDPDVLDLFRESQNRVAAIALVHERLFRSEDLAHIELGEYLNGVVQQVEAMQRTPSPRVSVVGEAIRVGVDLALPCGLIVNELCTNGLKQSRESGSSEALTFKLEARGNEIVLTFTAGGQGSGSLDVSEIARGGIDLVDTLVEQIQGKICTHGPKLEITFPWPTEDQ